MARSLPKAGSRATSPSGNESCMKYHNRASESLNLPALRCALSCSLKLSRTVPIRSGTSRSIIVRLTRLTTGVTSVTLRVIPMKRRQALRDGAVFTHRCGTVAVV